MNNPPSLDLFSLLNGRDGFYILGEFSSLDPIFGTEQFGFSVSAAGDINHDGIADLIIGARHSAVGAQDRAGKSFVIFGNANIGAGGSFELTTINGSNGFLVNGVDAGERSGQSVSSAGDFNGDGVDDLIIGSLASNIFEFTNFPDGTEASLFSLGRAYVLFGKTGGLAASINVSDITTDVEYQPDRSATVNPDYSKGFSIRSLFSGTVSDTLAGFSVSPAGDLDKDGFDDLLIGVPGSNLPGNTLPGQAWIVYGQEPNPTGSAPIDRDRDFYRSLRVTYINGITAKDRTGNSVSSAGDVNGDGIPDIVIGARDAASRAGQSYVVFGGTPIIPGSSSGSNTKTFNLTDLNGSNGFKISGAGAGERSGWAVSGAGDINGDGADDLIIGAPSVINSPTNQPDAAIDPTKPGKTYVVFGKNVVTQGNFAANLDLASLNGTNGFVINGINGGDGAGFSVSSAGDINADGFDDLVISAPFAEAGSLFGEAGETYIVYGGQNIGGGGRLNLSALDGQNGFALKGTFSDDRSGWSVSKAGDLNADGVDDLIIGAVESQGLPGKSYIMFGNARPNLDLNGSATGIDFATTDRIGNAAALVSNSLTLIDNTSSPTKTTIKQAIVKISNLRDGATEQLTADTNGTGITAAYNADTGTLTLSGLDTAANYQQVLRTLKYQNTAANPNLENRTIEFVVTDAALFNTDSAVARTVVQLLPASRDVFQIEAEALTLETYRVEDNAFASGGKLISLRDASGTTGSASTQFTGKAGNYNILIHYVDETDGEATLDLQVNSQSVNSWLLNKNLGSNTPLEQTFTERFIQQVYLEPGNTLSIKGTKNGDEETRVDSIQIIPVQDFTQIEAEDMVLGTYQIENNNVASGRKLISLRDASSNTGTASTQFTGQASAYDITVGYLDEADGQATLALQVNGTAIDSWLLNKNLGSNDPLEQTFTERKIKGVSLNAGSTLTLTGMQDKNEWARVDFIRITPSSAGLTTALTHPIS